MALPSLIDRALASSGANPTWGMMILVAAWSAVVISALRTVDHLSPLKTVARCVSGGGRCDVVSVPHGDGWMPLHMYGCVLWRRVR